jgi:hypothetical protein
MKLSDDEMPDSLAEVGHLSLRIKLRTIGELVSDHK